MLKQVNVKTIVTAIVFGATVSVGTYFFLPPPTEAYACSQSTVQSTIKWCMDGARISNGRISTYC